MKAASVPELLLALSTATGAGSAALLGEGGVVATTSWDGALGHAEAILPATRRLLDAAGASLDRVGAVGVCTGPGSFVGTRVALSTAKGLAVARSVTVVGVSSLAALAGLVDGAGAVAVIDARRGEAYVEVFREGAGDGARLLPVADVVSLAASAGLPIVGDLTGVATVVAQPTAEAVGRLALARWRRGDVDDAASLEPTYLRAPDFG